MSNKRQKGERGCPGLILGQAVCFFAYACWDEQFFLSIWFFGTWCFFQPAIFPASVLPASPDIPASQLDHPAIACHIFGVLHFENWLCANSPFSKNPWGSIGEHFYTSAAFSTKGSEGVHSALPPCGRYPHAPFFILLRGQNLPDMHGTGLCVFFRWRLSL